MIQTGNVKAWNRLLIFAVLVLFAINTWLVKTLLSITTDVELLGAGTGRELLKNNHANKQAQILLQNAKPQLCASSIYIDKDKAIVLGNREPTKDFLTIAIPTVKRDQKDYLQQTLDSLIENSTPEERSVMTVVIFAANFDDELNKLLKIDLESSYRKYFSNGFMQLIVAPRSFYPPLNNLKQNFGDSEDRVKWRAKQVVDYAFLFSYCHDLSEYYLQLEDDVVSSPNFVQSIRGFLETNKQKQWKTLEFSELGFIGKLVRSSDLLRLAQFMLFFYEEQPVDFLQKYYNLLNAQEGMFRHAPSIFQHVGVQSSLRNKEQELVDRFFEANSGKKYQSDNPPAVLYSSMEAFSMYVPQLAYSSKPGYFWGKTPIMGDTLLLVFETPVRLSRVVILSGSDTYPEDILRAGKVEVSPVVLTISLDSTPRCTDYQFIGEFNEGKFDERNLDQKIDSPVKCIQVKVTKSQQSWLLVKEIAVWVHR
ncbi:alpha-1,6-mannosyl-glycoprotein 4-beta-N-acetylglucosaminyltransferase-like [Asterias amurensis]|uniref:alpha-1,6-mannosyl-glycoprotein 4-beta-N-acetylglucosaminyltransferase-like n=1 Tax=Asterias amurensis TaxID=7602 RepID=UPI003AB67D96